MPIPRYKDADGRFDIFLLCKCGYAIEKCSITKDWKECRLCGKPLRTARVDFNPPYKTTYADGKPPSAFKGARAVPREEGSLLD